jgi:peptidoglycan/xylan/chitin deacetylase (PgdA/CDA1 family)
MLEPHIRLYADVVQRMAQEGHALGSHGVTHQHNIFYKSTESMISEMDQTIAAIREITGIGSPLIRVPYGSVPNVSQNQMKVLAAHGYKLWDWNVDSSDWRTQDARYVTTTIKQVQKLRDMETSSIILLHDMKGTAAHLSSLLDYLKKYGYVFCVLDPSLPEYHIGSSYPK